jgi:hypothetical protein
MEQGGVSGQNLTPDRRIEIVPIDRLRHPIVQAN